MTGHLREGRGQKYRAALVAFKTWVDPLSYGGAFFTMVRGSGLTRDSVKSVLDVRFKPFYVLQLSTTGV